MAEASEGKMEKFTADNIHTESSIRKLSAVQYNIFGLRKQLNIFLMGGICVAVAVFVDLGEVGSALLMLLGCWLVVSTKLPQVRQTDKLIKLMNGTYPESHFSFSDTAVDVHTGGDVQTVPYMRLVCLAHDKENIYLFISIMSAYMFPTASIKPQDAERFENFISKETGLRFVTPSSIFRLSVRELKVRAANRRVLRSRKHN